MTSSKISPHLSHLSKDELEELIDFYYGDEFTIKDLLNLYNVKISSSKLVKHFPPFEDLDVLCPFCNRPMTRKWLSRHSVGKERLSTECYCSICGHKGYGKSNSWEHCSCGRCSQNKQLQQKQRVQDEWEQIYQIYGRERHFHFTGEVLDIDLRSAIYLLSMERQSVSGEIGIFSPVSQAEKPCSPDTELTIEIIRYLHRMGYMRVDPASKRDAFSIEDEKIPFYLVRAQYYADLGSSLDESKVGLRALELSFKNRDWPLLWRYGWQETIREIWQQLSLYECFLYLGHLAQERSFEIPRGDKTRVTLLDALNEQPISVVYSYLWSAMRSASDYFQKGGVSRKQAANSIVGHIQMYADNVRLGAWQPRHYGRYRGLPQSALYEVLFNLVLQIGEDGFNKTFDNCLVSLSWIDEGIGLEG